MNEPQCAFHIDFTRGDIISNFSCAQSGARLRRRRRGGGWADEGKREKKKERRTEKKSEVEKRSCRALAPVGDGVDESETERERAEGPG